MEETYSIKNQKEIWDFIYRNPNVPKYPPENTVRFIAQNYYSRPDPKKVKILDLGCGVGPTTWYLAREGFSVTGIDYSDEAIKIAKKRLADERLEADLRVGDFSILSTFSENSFDAVIDNGAICCNPLLERQTILRNVYRLLKPEGKIQSMILTDKTWGCGTGEEIEPNGFLNTSEGPLVGGGFLSFLNLNQVKELFKEFTSVGIEKNTRTLANLTQVYEFWIVEGTKS